MVILLDLFDSLLAGLLTGTTGQLVTARGKQRSFLASQP
jgi:hypothetical protein